MATSARLLSPLKSNSELIAKNNSEHEASLKYQIIVLGSEIDLHKKTSELHDQKEKLHQQRKNFFDKSIKALVDNEEKLHEDNKVFFEEKLHPLLREKEKLHNDQKEEFKKYEEDFDDRKKLHQDEIELNDKRRRLLDKEREHLVELQKKLDEQYDSGRLMNKMLSEEADKLNKRIYRTLGDKDGKIFGDGGLLENMELFKKDSQAYVDMVSQRFKDKMLSPFRKAKETASALWNAGKFSFGFLKSLFRNTEESGREGAAKLKSIQDSESEERIKQKEAYYESKRSQAKAAPVPIEQPVLNNVLKFQPPSYSVIAKTAPTQKSGEESDSNISAKETEINSSADEIANELEQKDYRSKVLEYLKIIAEKESGTEVISQGSSTDGGGFGLPLNLFRKPFNWIFNKVKSGLKTVLNGAKNVFNKVKGSFRNIPSVVSKSANVVKNAASKSLNAVKNAGPTATKVANSVSNLASKSLNVVKNVGSSATNIASKSLNAVKNVGSSAANLASKSLNAVKNVGPAATKIASKVSNLAKPVMNVASKIASPVSKVAGIGLKGIPIVGTALGFALDAGLGAMKAKEWNTSKSSAVGASIIAGAGPSIDDPNASVFDKAASIGGNALKWGSVGGMIGGPVGAAIGALGGAVVAAIGGERIAKAVDWVKEKGSAAVEGVKNVAKKGLSFVKDAFINNNPIVIGAKFLGKNVLAAKDVMKEGLKTVGSKLKDGVKSIGSFASNVFGSVTSFFSGKKPDETDKAKEPLKTLNGANLPVKDENKPVLAGATGPLSSKVSPIKTFVTGATMVKEKLSDVKEAMSEKINVVKDGLSRGFDRAVETKDIVKNKLINVGKSVLDKISGFGGAIGGAIFGLGNRVKAFSDQVEAKRKSIFGQIADGFTRFFGREYDVNSPESQSLAKPSLDAKIDERNKPFVPEINVATDFSLVKNKLSELEDSVYDNTNSLVSNFNSEASKTIEPKPPIEDLAIKIGTVIAKLINENNMKVIEALLEINTYAGKIAENTSKPTSVPVFYQQNKTDYLGYLRYKIPGLAK